MFSYVDTIGMSIYQNYLCKLEGPPIIFIIKRECVPKWTIKFFFILIKTCYQSTSRGSMSLLNKILCSAAGVSLIAHARGMTQQVMYKIKLNKDRYFYAQVEMHRLLSSTLPQPTQVSGKKSFRLKLCRMFMKKIKLWLKKFAGCFKISKY